MNKITNLFVDTKTMAGRCLLLTRRNPDMVLTSFVAPVMMMILFAYVLGGAINVGSASYVNYIVPGIILQSLGQCATTTAISVSTDIKTGIIDRFCTMPIKKSSILSGHVWESFARNGLATSLVVAVAFLVGFRPKADFAGWLLVLLILSLYILAISWCSIFFGIIAKSPEGAGAFSVFAIILPYLSSGFVPTDTMPKALELFAEHQPMTPIIDTLRTVLQGEELQSHTLAAAILWCALLLTFFYFLSVKAFRKNISR